MPDSPVRRACCLPFLSRLRASGTVSAEPAAEKKSGSAIAEIVLSLVISTFGTLAYLYINKVVAGDWFMFSVYQKSNWSQGLGFFFDTARYMYQRAIGDLKAALGCGSV